MFGQWHEGGNGWQIAFVQRLVIGTKDHMLEAQAYIVKWLASGMAELILEFQDCIVEWLANAMDLQ